MIGSTYFSVGRLTATVLLVKGVDKFSIRRRHHYATTVFDFEKEEIPYVAKDRTKESLAGEKADPTDPGFTSLCSSIHTT